MKSLKVILISSILPAIVLLSGCNERSGGANDGSAKSPASSEAEGYPKFIRAWVGADGLEYSDEASSIAYNPNTRALVEERFKGVEWGNGQAKASFTMHLDAERSLKFTSESGVSSDPQSFLAIWTRPGPTIGGATSAIVKRSRPIPSAEKALEMLHQFMANDGDIQSVGDWEE